MVGLDGAQLAHQGVVLGVGDLGIVEHVIALVVVGDQPAQLLGTGHRIITGGRRPPRSPAGSGLFRAHPTIPEPSTTDGWLGS